MIDFLRTGHTVDQFWRLTLREINLHIVAFNKNRDDQLYRDATWTAHLMNASGNMRTRMTARKLLGGDTVKRVTQQKPATEANNAAAWSAIGTAVGTRQQQEQYRRRLAATKEESRQRIRAAQKARQAQKAAGDG